MALNTALPEEVYSQIVEADVWFLSGVSFFRPVNGQSPTINLEISCGQIQPDSSIDWVFTFRHSIVNVLDENGDPVPGEDWLTQFMTKVSQTDETFKQMLLRLCYGYMKQRNLAPATATDVPEPID